MKVFVIALLSGRIDGVFSIVRFSSYIFRNNKMNFIESWIMVICSRLQFYTGLQECNAICKLGAKYQCKTTNIKCTRVLLT